MSLLGRHEFGGSEVVNGGALSYSDKMLLRSGFLLGLWLIVLVSAGEDFYKLLGVGKDANDREIRKAFKKLALQYHPDKNKVITYICWWNFFFRLNYVYYIILYAMFLPIWSFANYVQKTFMLKDDPKAHDHFVKINRAYEVLKDEEMRKKYDLHGEEGIKDGSGQNYQSWTFYKNQFGMRAILLSLQYC